MRFYFKNLFREVDHMDGLLSELVPKGLGVEKKDLACSQNGWTKPKEA